MLESGKWVVCWAKADQALDEMGWGKQTERGVV